MMINLTDTELLWELISRNKLDIAPKKTEYHGEWLQANIAIGADNTASIMMTAEDYEKLLNDISVKAGVGKQEVYY